MKYKCPYTDICRAEALRQFADFPEFALIVQQRLQCNEQDDARARRCATRLGLIELQLPSLGGYIQERRRSQHIPQRQLAQQVGVDVQMLRDLELDKTDPSNLPRLLLERFAGALSESVEYLSALTRIGVSSSAPRLGAAFTRTNPLDENQETK